MSDEAFRTVRTSPITIMHGVIPSLFLALFIFGDGWFKVVGMVGALVCLLGLILDRGGSVTIREDDIEVRTLLRTNVPYGSILEVKPYEEPQQPAWENWVFGPGFRDLKQAYASASVGLYLRKPKWIIYRGPIPGVVRFNTVRIHLADEDDSRFMEAVKTRMNRLASRP
jgi:hypothetical protein